MLLFKIVSLTGVHIYLPVCILVPIAGEARALSELSITVDGMGESTLATVLLATPPPPVNLTYDLGNQPVCNNMG